MTSAEGVRFKTFVEATVAGERDWIAFQGFESAIWNAAISAARLNPYDAGEVGSHERSLLELTIREMIFRVLLRVTIASVMATIGGIGYAIRYGILEPRGDALDGVPDTAAFEALAAKGYEADHRESKRRLAEIKATQRVVYRSQARDRR